jgi:hypothetical protein
MIKRASLVWKRPELTEAEFRSLWLGEHVEHAQRLTGLREYVIDFIPDPPTGAPHGIATLRFDTLAALQAAFDDRNLKEHLLRTRDRFAASVIAAIVDEYVIVPRTTDKR